MRESQACHISFEISKNLLENYKKFFCPWKLRRFVNNYHAISQTTSRKQTFSSSVFFSLPLLRKINSASLNLTIPQNTKSNFEMKRSCETVYTRSDLKSRIFYFGSRDTISHCKLLFRRYAWLNKRKTRFGFSSRWRSITQKHQSWYWQDIRLNRLNILVLWWILSDDWWLLLIALLWR